MYVLPDTSIWISFFNEPSSPNSERMSKLILEDRVCICPTVHQEILQGTKDQQRFQILSEKLASLNQLKSDPYLAASGAAQIYSSLRQKGVTIRKSNDCLIAWYAIKFDIPVWHNDRDFDLFASYILLRTFNI